MWIARGASLHLSITYQPSGILSGGKRLPQVFEACQEIHDLEVLRQRK
jgi:hypothetical protein